VWNQSEAPTRSSALDPRSALDPATDRAAPAPRTARLLGAGGSVGDAAQLAATFAHFAEAPPRLETLARAEAAYDRAADTVTSVLGQVAPAYVRARDALDAAAVLEIGGRLIAAVSVAHGAQRACDQLLASVPRQSVVGESLDDTMRADRALDSLAARAPMLAPLIAGADRAAAATLLPHTFRGREVAPAAPRLDPGVTDEQRRTRLAGELTRTAGMLDFIAETRQALADGKARRLDTLEAARRRLGAFASRPIDLAFLKAALGELWDILEATAGGGPLDRKPSEVLADAEKQAELSGWLGDVGRFHLGTAIGLLRAGGRDDAELVLSDLATADPEARTRMLARIHELGLLPNLCSAVGWAAVKDLHDGLDLGYTELKAALQPWFIGPGKWGPSVGEEWEDHDRSARSFVAKLGFLGDAINFTLDMGTFGFYSSYSKAVDDRSQGLTSESEYRRAKAHAAGSAIVVGAASLLTGGVADKLVRGGAASVSVARAAAAGAAGGSVGAVGGLLAHDGYGNFVSGDQHGLSSIEDYAKAALLGGALGGALGGTLQGLSDRSARYAAAPESQPALGAGLDSAARLQHLEAAGLKAMVGDHIFTGTPAELEAALARLRAAGVDARVTAGDNGMATVRIGTDEIYVHGGAPGAHEVSAFADGEPAFDTAPASARVHVPTTEPADVPEFPVALGDVRTVAGNSHYLELVFEARLPDGRTIKLGSADAWPPGEGTPPQMNLNSHRVLDGRRYRFTIYEDVAPVPGSTIPAPAGQRISLTRHALRELVVHHKQAYGVEPAEIGGYLGVDNLKNFQIEYARLRPKAASDREAVLGAIEKVSFGRARVAEKYSDFSYDPDLRFEEVDLGGDLGVRRVPTNVDVVARKKP
jgi:hypothetical protein